MRGKVNEPFFLLFLFFFVHLSYFKICVYLYIQIASLLSILIRLLSIYIWLSGDVGDVLSFLIWTCFYKLQSKMSISHGTGPSG